MRVDRIDRQPDGLHAAGHEVSGSSVTASRSCTTPSATSMTGRTATRNDCGNGPHPDCMQTFYSDTYPTSSDITIEGKHCQNAAAQCLIAEGPALPGEGVNGPGQSIGWTSTTTTATSARCKPSNSRTSRTPRSSATTSRARTTTRPSPWPMRRPVRTSGNKVSSKIGKLITFDDADKSPRYVGPKPDQ